jgi:1,2-diacylglycerol 3-beta-galactosyltransferase
MARQKHFLILTSDSGFGHRSAANSIAKALKLEHPQEVTTSIINPILEEPSSLFLQKAELNYDHSVKQNPGFYRFTYEISDSRSASAVVENTLVLAMYKNMKQLIQNSHVDGIVNTNQLFNAPAGVALNSLNLKIPFYTVVTDLADVHSMWFNSNPDRFFVASNAVRSKALASGIPLNKITISGIPVDPDIESSCETRAQIRARSGIAIDLTTILVVGSSRVSGICEHLEALEKLPFPFQVVVIAGGNDKLYAKLQQRVWNFPIFIHNFVTNMPDWLLSADLLITKAGGLILSEGLAAGLPIIMIDYLPGQEEGNVRYILDQHAGEIVENPDEMYDVINSWLRNDQALLKGLANKSRTSGHPEAATVIANALWQATENDSWYTIPSLSAWSNFD